jgi:hypothetical protein
VRAVSKEGMRSALLVARLSVAVSALALGVERAEACTCGGPPPITVYRTAAVFVAKVERVRLDMPFSLSIAAWRQYLAGEGPRTAVLSVERVFRGNVAARVAVPHGVCDVWFTAGERWLVYAHPLADEGEFLVSACGRSRRIESAAQDLRYLEGRAKGEALGVIHGRVQHRTRGGYGGFETVEPVDLLTVVAVAGDRRTATPMLRWGVYELVLPRGRHEVWVERDGRRVSATIHVDIADGEAARGDFVTDY